MPPTRTAADDGPLFRRFSLPLLVLALGSLASSPPLRAEELPSLIAATLASHPTVQAQAALVASAQAQARGARWQYYPTPSVTIDASRTRAADPAFQGDDRVATLRIQQPLWSGGRLAAGVERADAAILVNRAGYEDAQQQLALRVVQAYGDWLAAHLTVQAVERSLAVHERLLAQVQRRIAQGASGASDAQLAVTRLQSVKAEQEAAQVRQEIALQRLGQLSGQTVEATRLSRSFARPLPMEASAEAAVERAIANNPGLQRALAVAAVRQAEIAERRAAAAPEVSLRLERQYGNAAIARTEPVNRVFIGLSSNFGAGLSSLTAIDAAKAQQQAAAAEASAQALGLREQIVADHLAVVSAGRRLEALEASIQAARAVSESFDRQFLAGRKTWLEVMNAARELAQLEIQSAEVRAPQLVANWRLAIVSRGIDAATGQPR